ncbi:unnamed protein product [Closterium sp. Naga37s-1]|nr:unnamed protein product [Closterium sp. Naga37s-1]
MNSPDVSEQQERVSRAVSPVPPRPVKPRHRRSQSDSFQFDPTNLTQASGTRLQAVTYSHQSGASSRVGAARHRRIRSEEFVIAAFSAVDATDELQGPPVTNAVAYRGAPEAIKASGSRGKQPPQAHPPRSKPQEWPLAAGAGPTGRSNRPATASSEQTDGPAGWSPVPRHAIPEGNKTRREGEGPGIIGAFKHGHRRSQSGGPGGVVGGGGIAGENRRQASPQPRPSAVSNYSDGPSGRPGSAPRNASPEEKGRREGAIAGAGGGDASGTGRAVGPRSGVGRGGRKVSAMGNIEGSGGEKRGGSYGEISRGGVRSPADDEYDGEAEDVQGRRVRSSGGGAVGGAGGGTSGEYGGGVVEGAAIWDRRQARASSDKERQQQQQQQSQQQQQQVQQGTQQHSPPRHGQQQHSPPRHDQQQQQQQAAQPLQQPLPPLGIPTVRRNSRSYDGGPLDLRRSVKTPPKSPVLPYLGGAGAAGGATGGAAGGRGVSAYGSPLRSRQGGQISSQGAQRGSAAGAGGYAGGMGGGGAAPSGGHSVRPSPGWLAGAPGGGASGVGGGGAGAGGGGGASGGGGGAAGGMPVKKKMGHRSPGTLAAQEDRDQAKLAEIQSMFANWNHGTPIPSPKAGASARAEAGFPLRTPQPSDYYRIDGGETEGGEGMGEEESAAEELGPTRANVLGEPYSDIRKKYKLAEKELGRGNFGVIHVGENLQTGEQFACKSITKAKFECWDDVEDVRREVSVLETLRGHPFVVSIVETMEDEDEVHIVMELCAGGELFDRILDRKYYGERQAARVIRSVVEVLAYCQARGIVHRDLKPENILLVSKRSDTRVKVIDFGMACILKSGERCKLRAGTPNYIAPEVIAKNYGAEADVWSAGVILYVLLCGLPPFWGDTTEDVFKSILWQELDFETEPWPVVSTAAKDLVRRMLCRKYERRITVAEILRSLSFSLFVSSLIFSVIPSSFPLHSLFIPSPIPSLIPSSVPNRTPMD